MVNNTCKACENTFDVQPSRLKHGRGLYCSRECQYESKRVRTKALKRVCLCCSNEFSIAPSKLKRNGGGKYCSRKCRDQHWVGENSIHWQGGAGVYKRGPRWKSIRRKVLKRDGGCQHCPSTINLHVHHKIPFRMFDSPDEANDLENLITLCDVCHRTEEAQYKWVKIADGGCLQFGAGGFGWDLVKSQGLFRG